MVLPADSHVHSEYSWDTGGPSSPTAAGTMERTCARAVQIGLPGVVFTEHLDITGWTAAPQDFLEHQRHLIDTDGFMQPPMLDVEAYVESIERCRRLFPDLRILTGVEFGQPHLDHHAAARIVDLASLDRINGSLHTLPFNGNRSEPPTMFRELPEPADVIWAYLAEISAVLEGGASFEVFTHIDYAARYEATALLEHLGFRPGRNPEDLWTR